MLRHFLSRIIGAVWNKIRATPGGMGKAMKAVGKSLRYLVRPLKKPAKGLGKNSGGCMKTCLAYFMVFFMTIVAAATCIIVTYIVVNSRVPSPDEFKSRPKSEGEVELADDEGDAPELGGDECPTKISLRRGAEMDRNRDTLTQTYRPEEDLDPDLYTNFPEEEMLKLDYVMEDQTAIAKPVKNSATSLTQPLRVGTPLKCGDTVYGVVSAIKFVGAGNSQNSITIIWGDINKPRDFNKAMDRVFSDS